MPFKFRISFLIFAFVLSTQFASAATYQCDTPEEKQNCQNLLNQTEAEINSLNTQLGSVKQEGDSLAKDKQILDIKIKQAQLEIKKHDLEIASLGKQIAQKTATIQTLQGHIDTGTASLAQILRQTNQIDDYSLPELLLGSQNLSDAFADLDSFDAVKVSMAATFTELHDAQQQNEDAKVTLAKTKDKEIDTKAGIESEKAKVQAAEAEKQRLLNLNKTEQNNYQQVIASKAAQVAQIKAALFKLAGAAAIQFGDAVQFARVVQAATGVDPAFLLAIIKQESNLGSNVGKCYLTDTSSGYGVSSTGRIWTNLMKPSRDIPPFLDITSSLGVDPLKTVVSCPIAGAGGYGGAMGPAQFIPSTWKLFISRITAATGHSTPNPWDPQDAFMASGMYLADLGASGTSVASQSRAACKYYGSGGASCTYSRSVINLKNSIQSDIDVLNGN
ncbi:MAG: lytic murein transglycosylase [Patescibacteria group bacterium]